MQLKTSQISSIYKKLLYTRNIAPITIKFTKSNTLYDRTLSDINNTYINFLPYEISESIIDAQLLFINDPMDLVFRIQEFNSVIANKVLFFHDDKILRMKREDLFLFKQQIAKYPKCSFDHRICSLIEDTIPLNYGFKAPNKSLQNRNKSIIFLGNRQNIDAIAYNHLKQSYNDIDFLSIDETPNVDIGILLSNYKICISTTSLYNNLLAAASGCFVLSSLDNIDIPYYQKVSSFDDIVEKIKIIFDNYNSNLHNDISNYIIQRYNYEIFSNSISHIVKQTCNRATIL